MPTGNLVTHVKNLELHMSATCPGCTSASTAANYAFYVSTIEEIAAISVTDSLGSGGSGRALRAGDVVFLLSDTLRKFFVLRDEAGGIDAATGFIQPAVSPGNKYWEEIPIGESRVYQFKQTSWASLAEVTITHEADSSLKRVITIIEDGELSNDYDVTILSDTQTKFKKTSAGTATAVDIRILI